jgi:hypothetical protein
VSGVVERTVQRLDEQRRRLQLNLMTVAFFAIVIAFADGFWLTSMQGAVGAMQRTEKPLGRWLRDSTLMLPLYFFGVVLALVLARRLFGRSRSRLVKLGATALFITVVGTAVGLTEVAASSAYDYRLQTTSLEQKLAFDHSHNEAPPILAGTSGAKRCTGLCAQKELTLFTHVKAVKLAARLLLVSNLLAVLWVLMLRGDRVWRSVPTANDDDIVVEASRPMEAVVA